MGLINHLNIREKTLLQTRMLTGKMSSPPAEQVTKHSGLSRFFLNLYQLTENSFMHEEAMVRTSKSWSLTLKLSLWPLSYRQWSFAQQTDTVNKWEKLFQNPSKQKIFRPGQAFQGTHTLRTYIEPPLWQLNRPDHKRAPQWIRFIF